MQGLNSLWEYRFDILLGIGWTVQITFGAAAVALIGLGIYTGEPAQVAQKAVSVCFECIGVG